MQLKYFISVMLMIIMPAFTIMANEVNNQTNVKQEKEYDKQKLIIKYFMSHELVKYKIPADKIKFTVYQIKSEANYNHIPSDEIIKTIRNYNNIYLVDAESKAIKLKILYSLTKNKVTLISSYKLNEDKWQKLE